MRTIKTARALHKKIDFQFIYEFRNPKSRIRELR